MKKRKKAKLAWIQTLRHREDNCDCNDDVQHEGVSREINCDVTYGSQLYKVENALLAKYQYDGKCMLNMLQKRQILLQILF